MTYDFKKLSADAWRAHTKFTMGHYLGDTGRGGPTLKCPDPGLLDLGIEAFRAHHEAAERGVAAAVGSVLIAEHRRAAEKLSELVSDMAVILALKTPECP